MYKVFPNILLTRDNKEVVSNFVANGATLSLGVSQAMTDRVSEQCCDAP